MPLKAFLGECSTPVFKIAHIDERTPHQHAALAVNAVTGRNRCKCPPVRVYSEQKPLTNKVDAEREEDKEVPQGAGQTEYMVEGDEGL